MPANGEWLDDPGFSVPQFESLTPSIRSMDRQTCVWECRWLEVSAVLVL